MWNEVIRSDLKGRKVSKGIDKIRNAWKSYMRNCPTHASMKNRRRNKYNSDDDDHDDDDKDGGDNVP